MPQQKEKARRRPTLPPKGSTIGVRELNFRVRNGNGCGLSTIITGQYLRIAHTDSLREPCSLDPVEPGSRALFKRARGLTVDQALYKGPRPYTGSAGETKDLCLLLCVFALDQWCIRADHNMVKPHGGLVLLG